MLKKVSENSSCLLDQKSKYLKDIDNLIVQLEDYKNQLKHSRRQLADKEKQMTTLRQKLNELNKSNIKLGAQLQLSKQGN
jgi:uncharacterized short protein YbdD (DUF466 family)